MGDIIIVLLVFWVVGKLLKGVFGGFSKSSFKDDKYGQKRLVQEALNCKKEVEWNKYKRSFRQQESRIYRLRYTLNTCRILSVRRCLGFPPIPLVCQFQVFL